MLKHLAWITFLFLRTCKLSLSRIWNLNEDVQNSKGCVNDYMYQIIKEISKLYYWYYILHWESLHWKLYLFSDFWNSLHIDMKFDLESKYFSWETKLGVPSSDHATPVQDPASLDEGCDRLGGSHQTEVSSSPLLAASECRRLCHPTHGSANFWNVQSLCGRRVSSGQRCRNTSKYMIYMYSIILYPIMLELNASYFNYFCC